jgi:flagellar hook-associated protein 1 FlgK
MSVSRVFDIARRSLGVYQNAIYVTSHNISNASNPNYSRQRVIFGTEYAEMNGGFVWGSGVKIDEINRVRDKLNDSQIRLNNQKLAYNQSRSVLLGQLESVFTEPTDLGLASVANEFFNSWSELSVTPNSMALRNNVIQKAEKLSNRINNLREEIDTMKSGILSDFKSKVTSLNSLIAQINDLNQQIIKTSAVGQKPNDLIDKRDQAIDELSKLANISVSYNENDAAMISIGGVFAIDNVNYVQFKITQSNGKLQLSTKDGDTSMSLTGGELFALSETYSNTIPDYMSQLDGIVNAIYEKVNDEHQKGYTIDNPPQTGLKFFESYINGELKINEYILNDPKKIAISSDGTNGNGDIAVAISELQSAQILNGTTISEAYSFLVSNLGSDKLNAVEIAEGSELVSAQLEQQRSSVSGVSIDEEMTNLIAYQRSYDASAKLIQVADEMLETIMEII